VVTETCSQGYLQEQANARRGSPSFWNVEYYQVYFDVDTKQVLRRCYSTLLPTSSSYLTTHLTPSADLYGPFWTLTTLIFTLFLSSSLAASISVYLSDPGTAQYDYDFQLLSVAVSIVYAYGLLFPILIWLALRYIGIGQWSVVEAVAVWGYGQFVWVPVSVSQLCSGHMESHFMMTRSCVSFPFPSCAGCWWASHLAYPGTFSYEMSTRSWRRYVPIIFVYLSL
jgi:hypothetical protein